MQSQIKDRVDRVKVFSFGRILLGFYLSEAKDGIWIDSKTQKLYKRFYVNFFEKCQLNFVKYSGLIIVGRYLLRVQIHRIVNVKI